MIKVLHLKTLPAAFMLVLFLAVSFLGAEGTLLCFSKDGHVAVEFVDSCNGPGLGSQLARGESDACGPCKDVQFISDPAYTGNVSHYSETLPLASLTPMSPALPAHENSVKPTDPPIFSHRNKTLDSLQSVILLI